MPQHINGYPLAEVERVEGLIKDLGGRVGLGDISLESGSRYRQFDVMNGDRQIGKPATLGEVEKMVRFAINIYDEAVVAGIDDYEAPY